MNKKILILTVLLISVFMFPTETLKSASSETALTYNQNCEATTGKFRSMVRENWSSIRDKASFTVSSRASFELEDVSTEGGYIYVDIYSEGYMYDISFTVKFDAAFDDNCEIKGYVVSVFNYEQR